MLGVEEEDSFVVRRFDFFPFFSPPHRNERFGTRLRGGAGDDGKICLRLCLFCFFFFFFFTAEMRVFVLLQGGERRRTR